MKLLDRYLFGVFISAFFIFLLAFLSLFLIVDFSTRLNRFLLLPEGELVGFILTYYGARMPLFLLYVLPTVTLFASMFSFVKLQKTNELVPIVTSGISLRRLSLPFVGASLVTSAFAFGLDEFALPRLMPVISQTDETLVSKRVTSDAIAYDVQRNYVRAREYDRETKIMSEVTLTCSRANNNTLLVVNARTAEWKEASKRWVFSYGDVEHYDESGAIVREPGGPGRPPRIKKDLFGAEGWTLENSSIVPGDLIRRISLSGDFAPLQELRRKVRHYPHVPSFRVAVHTKFSFPLSCVVLLFLGLPFVVTPHGKSFVKGLTLCFLVTAAFYVVHFSLIDRGNAGRIDPALASWGATILGTIVGGASFVRMRS